MGHSWFDIYSNKLIIINTKEHLIIHYYGFTKRKTLLITIDNILVESDKDVHDFSKKKIKRSSKKIGSINFEKKIKTSYSNSQCIEVNLLINLNENLKKKNCCNFEIIEFSFI